MTNHDKPKYDEEAAIQAAQERSGEPPLRDLLKREHDEAQKRPRNEALEKWGGSFFELLRDNLEVPRWLHDEIRQPTKKGPDIDR